MAGGAGDNRCDMHQAKGRCANACRQCVVQGRIAPYRTQDEHAWEPLHVESSRFSCMMVCGETNPRTARIDQIRAIKLPPLSHIMQEWGCVNRAKREREAQKAGMECPHTSGAMRSGAIGAQAAYIPKVERWRNWFGMCLDLSSALSGTFTAWFNFHTYITKRKIYETDFNNKF